MRISNRASTPLELSSPILVPTTQCPLREGSIINRLLFANYPLRTQEIGVFSLSTVIDGIGSDTLDVVLTEDVHEARGKLPDE
ncbi:hypothetical protein X769_33300 [Mesorhizobium sp. LSJC268A00]|nr:hypothetical protein X769_33300 [Mesorhizobium sp. LSJC268A00]